VRRIAHNSHKHSTNYYTYSGVAEPDRELAYGSTAAPNRDTGHFSYGPNMPYPSTPAVTSAPIYNFYGPTNNFFGPIYNYGQIGNVRVGATPDLSGRLNPWHGYDRNNGLENGY
jgi:hypothetical protein